ncbi:hypothetical protein GALMADRAFT_137860 [Galerina marginata CBS 339.88]|uniref:PIN domain-like protein n=1 Tax=Galerina marginata (strain CBS 339.88) TaxID=685588 RepID=A0A067TG46_GALM3|nr:hypothetical protein GALMADRAFT_137860 [Galerina marginata CBS 339.88]
MGVKSLWTLLTPVGRPVMLETVEGKTMAIDSSIWLYQFQATMRDKEGRALVNAHVLGFLRRISKLLFYGIKPVFVFDGGAPALKRNTLNERKKKKSGAALSHTKLAEKLLAAQMRREALNQAGNGSQTKSKGSKGKGRELHDAPLNDDTVYLEDLDGSAPKTPVKRKPPTPSSSSKKKNKFHDHDPYRLPQVDMEEAIAKATRSAAPDPRLATEDELQTFIEQMRPEDFDVNSPAFRELPTEVQYEIIGDLRLKSRQTSYARLHKMLKTSRTPLDFSKQQIQNLRQRNALTQQLLTTTDTIGSAHIAIPVRIASERNREYILMKNEGDDGGWILGIKDTGTREKPIVLDHEEDVALDDEDTDADMEEVEVPAPAAPDPDLREYQREMALAGHSKRSTSKRLLPRPINRKTKSTTLFQMEEDFDVDEPPQLQSEECENDDDLLAYAIQESLDQSKLSKKHPSPSVHNNIPPGSLPQHREVTPEDDFYADYETPNRLDTALAIANAGPSRIHSTPPKVRKISSLFGTPSMLLSSPKTTPTHKTTAVNHDESILRPTPSQTSIPQLQKKVLFSELDLGDKPMPQSFTLSGNLLRAVENPQLYEAPQAISVSNENMDEVPVDIQGIKTPSFTLSGNLPAPAETLASEGDQSRAASESDEDMEEVPVDVEIIEAHSFFTLSENLLDPIKSAAPVVELPVTSESDEETENVPFETRTPSVPESREPHAFHPPSAPMSTINSQDGTAAPQDPQIPQSVQNDTAEEPLFAWSRTPSPGLEMAFTPPTAEADEWDAVDEMDVHAEEGEFARFLSQVKGRNMDDVRKEIDDEINNLNHQRKIAMRDSEDITQQMIAQIMTMLRLFGIPYITAPMEAEAQCAELVSLNLVDGVITDDSDVFLFGAQRVYKNMFNQSKTVECFLLTDLSRELGLDRDTLIHLAYLLGSDYTEGLPGVGPVVAMELLKEFPGHNGLHKFKDWWMKVQSGKDRADDNQSKFRKQFKKKFKNLYLASDWPNSVVRDAYHHPAVDSSEEPFKWGLPDLDGLRAFFHEELGWQQGKVDELLLPIIQRMNKRNQVAALNKQSNLNDFLDLSAGSGTHAPRKRQAYQSKRLQQVISDFRHRQKSGSATPPQEENGESGNSSHEEQPPAKKQKRKASVPASGKGKARAKSTAASQPRRGASTSSKGRGRGRARTKKGKSDEDLVLSEDGGDDEFTPAGVDEATLQREIALRPRPKPRPIRRGAGLSDAGLTPIWPGETKELELPLADS